MVRAAWAWTRVLGGVGILAFVLWRLGTSAFLDSLQLLTGWTLAAALGIGLMTTVFSAWRWCLVARGLGIDLPLRTAIADYYRALFVNAALPSGILGDVHRAVRNGKESGDVGRGVRAVVLERFVGQVVLITFGVTVLLSHPTLAHHVNLPRALVAIIGVALVIAGVVLWVRRRGGGSRLRRGLRTGVTDVRRGLLDDNRWPLLLLSSAIVIAGHLAMFVVAARAAGSHAPFLRLLPLMMLALFAMTLPVNIGGWGPREGVTAWAFGAAGLGATQGLTIAVLYGLFAFIAALPGVVVIVGQWAARMKAARVTRDAAVPATRDAAVPATRDAAVPATRDAVVPATRYAAVPATRIGSVRTARIGALRAARVAAVRATRVGAARASRVTTTPAVSAIAASPSNAIAPSSDLAPLLSAGGPSADSLAPLPSSLLPLSKALVPVASACGAPTVVFVELPAIVGVGSSSTSVTVSSLASGRPDLVVPGRSGVVHSVTGQLAIDRSEMDPAMTEHNDVDLRVAEPALVVY
jgi:uncharacterized membrane protein YbhN (UPF0104 family)